MQQEFYELESADGEKFQLQEGHLKFVGSLAGFGMPPINHITKAGYQQDGETLVSTRYGPRSMTILHQAGNCSREAFYDRNLKLIDFLRHTRGGEMIFRFYSLVGLRFLYVALNDLGETPTASDFKGALNLSAQNQVIDFFCADPVWYGDLHTYQGVRDIDQEWSYEAAYPNYYGYDANDVSLSNLVYAGTYKSYPTIVVTGPATSIVFNNQTTGYKIALVLVLPTGVTLTIRPTANGLYMESTNGVDYTQYLTDDSSPIYAAIMPDSVDVPGGVNNISLSVGGTDLNTEVTLSYYDRYEGLF